MSASLDKALDDIIAEKPRPKKVGGPKGVKKPVSKNAKVGKTRPAPKRPTATSSLGKALDVSSATKAVVYGLVCAS